MAMFSKDPPADRSSGSRAIGKETTLSIISAGTTITGDIECSGVLKIEGRIEGSVRQARQIMLAREGSIQGDATAAEVVVGGTIDGNVHASDRLELQSTAVVNGEITTKSIVVMEGARINGGVKMTEIALVSREGARETREAARGGR